MLRLKYDDVDLDTIVVRGIDADWETITASPDMPKKEARPKAAPAAPDLDLCGVFTAKPRSRGRGRGGGRGAGRDGGGASDRGAGERGSAGPSRHNAMSSEELMHSGLRELELVIGPDASTGGDPLSEIPGLVPAGDIATIREILVGADDDEEASGICVYAMCVIVRVGGGQWDAWDGLE